MLRLTGPFSRCPVRRSEAACCSEGALKIAVTMPRAKTSPTTPVSSAHGLIARPATQMPEGSAHQASSQEGGCAAPAMVLLLRRLTHRAAHHTVGGVG